MTEAMVSPVETALENQRIGSLQIRVVALCGLVQICDAFDVNSIGIVVPSLTHAWYLPGPAFTVAFLWSSIGILLGAITAGPIGDGVGRKPLLIGSLVIFGIASLASALAGSLRALAILRFFTGLGIGGGFPGAASLTGDYAPRRCSLLNLFLFAYWLPEVLHLIGMTPADAARTASFREGGAIVAVLYLGVLIDRFGPERSLAWHFAAGIAFIAAIALVPMPDLLLTGAIFFAGMTIVGSQTGANAACGKLYPARIRTSGLGWALGVGRLGGIAAPVLGGYLLRGGRPPTHIFLSACLFALVAAIATGLLAFRGSRTAALTVGEAAP